MMAMIVIVVWLCEHKKKYADTIQLIRAAPNYHA